MGTTGALGKHPSTISYGWTVTKLEVADITTLDDGWIHWVTSAATKPFGLYVKRSNPNSVAYAIKALTLNGADKAAVGKYIEQVTNSVNIVTTGEADPEEFAIGDNDNSNTISATTVDATNKNEHFTSSTVLKSASNTIRVSQAFILQTDKLTYKTLPMAYFQGATADPKFESDAAKESLLWAIWASPEADMKGGNDLSLTWVVDTSAMCKTMANTDKQNEGEGDFKCLWNSETGLTI